MKVKVISAFSGAILGVAGSLNVVADDDASSVEERIKPVGSVVVASPAPAAQPEGMSGMSGMSGMEGTSGMSGMEGMSGMGGMSGMEGMSGMGGMSGAEGMSGMGGMAGMSGMAAAGADAEAVAQASGCLACHQIDARVVGPGYKEIAAKYKGDAAARDLLIEKVKNGGVGTWGQVPMPPNAHIGDEKIAVVVDWILSM